MEPRPPIRALVGYFSAPFGLACRPRVVSLEEAAQLHRLGYTVLIDPEDERDLARWERWWRAIGGKR